jgi:type 1 glutamine amidotransferase
VAFVFGGADATDNRGKVTEPRPTPAPNGTLLPALVARPISTDKNDLLGTEVIESADILLISARRRNPTAEQLDRVRKFVASGKPMVGIRTASHPFHLRDKAAPAGRADWPTFDADIWGGHYTNHYGDAKSGPNNTVMIADSAKSNPILTGWTKRDYHSGGTLYLTSPLAEGTHVLLTGHFADKPAEPEFAALLRNGLLWAAGLPIRIE